MRPDNMWYVDPAGSVKVQDDVGYYSAEQMVAMHNMLVQMYYTEHNRKQGMSVREMLAVLLLVAGIIALIIPVQPAHVNVMMFTSFGLIVTAGVLWFTRSK